MNEQQRHIYHGMQILVRDKWLANYAVVVENRKITAIIPSEMMSHHLPAKLHPFSHDAYLVPGFIDMHVHGAHGFDVMDDSVAALTGMSQALAQEGVTSFLATTLTASVEKIESVLQTIATAMTQPMCATILGVHLEGPFIAKDKMGAQNGDEIMAADSALLSHWQTLSQNSIKVVTLAPEIPNAILLIQTLHNMGIIASIGHTNATYTETMAAIHAGCTQATHLFNAMSGLHQRTPGATAALLLADNVIAEIIVDGIHVHPAMVDLAFKLKGKERLLLITDAMRAKCMRNGNYDLGGQSVTLLDNKVTLSDGTLAGSVLRMPVAIKNMVDYTHCDLASAINMATLNPASQLGIEAHKGSIEVGKDADMVVLDHELNVLMTVCEGREVYNVSCRSA